ncbi:hypothetical protein CMI48_02110 [Candidatus Pacearchaeota archaeon]|nr:hypothetical protein [Candidatus Pacearchaeota archaeon]
MKGKVIGVYTVLIVFALVLAALQFGLFGTITGQVIAEELSDGDNITVRKSITSLAVVDTEDSGFGRTGVLLVGALIVLGILLWVISRHRRHAAGIEHAEGKKGRKTIRLDLND